MDSPVNSLRSRDSDGFKDRMSMEMKPPSFWKKIFLNVLILLIWEGLGSSVENVSGAWGGQQSRRSIPGSRLIDVSMRS